jgi:hypothetical protein
LIDTPRTLPSLTTQGALYAASHLIGDTCDKESLAFLQCKVRDGNPLTCIKEGAQVTRCALGVFQRVYSSPCVGQFKEYVAALEKDNLNFDLARSQEAAFHACWNKKQEKE